MKPSRRLGRGLEDLVPLAPAAADGTARLEDALRGGPAASVLALSGRSVEDFVREESAAARPAPVPWTEPSEAPTEPVAPPPATSRVATAGAATPEPDPESRTGLQFVLFDPPIAGDTVAADELAEELPPRETAPPPVARTRPSEAAPRPAATLAPPPAPAREVVADDVAFLDDEVGGIVLPDVDLE